MMNTITTTQAPSEWAHTDLTLCDRIDSCHQLHHWAGGAPGPVVE